MNGGIQTLEQKAVDTSNLILATDETKNYFVIDGIKYKDRRALNRGNDKYKTFSTNSELDNNQHLNYSFSDVKIIVFDNYHHQYWTNQRKQKQHILK